MLYFLSRRSINRQILSKFMKYLICHSILNTLVLCCMLPWILLIPSDPDSLAVKLYGPSWLLYSNNESRTRCENYLLFWSNKHFRRVGPEDVLVLSEMTFVVFKEKKEHDYWRINEVPAHARPRLGFYEKSCSLGIVKCIWHLFHREKTLPVF